MDTTPDLTPLDVAQHWPFLRRHLTLDRHRSMLRALDTLASAQVQADGEPVELGQRRIRETAGLTNGEAGRVRMALAELESRRVAWHYPGAGSRASAWAFRSDLSHWRAMPWRWSGGAVEEAIRLCICRAASAFVARSPGQSVLQLCDRPEFHLVDADHLWRPGLLSVDNPVETRDNGGSRATNPKRTGISLVDTRDKFGPAGAPYCFSDVDIRLRRPDEDDDETLATLLQGVLRATGSRVWPGSAPERQLRALAGTVTPDQARAIAGQLAAYRVAGKPLRSPSLAAAVAVEIAASPGVKGLAG